MPGCPKKGTYWEFWNCGPQNRPRLYQNSEYIYIYIYDNIYGPAWGGILSFPEKDRF